LSRAFFASFCDGFDKSCRELAKAGCSVLSIQRNYT